MNSMVLDLLIAILIDFIIGDPYKFPHPVKLMGNIIKIEENIARKKTKNRKELRNAGLFISLLNIFIFFIIPYIILKLLKGKIHRVINIYLIYTCISAKSLDREAMKVVRALRLDLNKARFQLSHIVGRDTSDLDEKEIIKATIETVAENTSDGIIAPLFYIFILGAPGGLAYKMINTMDSMLGYKNRKYIDLGRYPAIIDDIFNFIPARLTGVFMCVSSIFKFNFIRGCKIMFRDNKKHPSPNAGWPEAAIAGILGIQLGGSSVYNGKVVEKPTLGDNRIRIRIRHIIDTIQIMYRTEILFVVTYLIIWFKLF